MCIFCKIVNKEIPNKTILEDDNFLAFYDINPARKVHALVIPKDHYDSFDKFPPTLMKEMSEFIHRVASKLEIRESGYRLITNIGEHGGQEVPHLHFHILAGEYAGRLVGEQLKK